MNSVETHPVVLIHGLIGPLSDARLVDAVGRPSVLAPDLLGYGAFADVAPQRITLDAQAEHIRAIIEDAGAPSHLVGHSIGGVIAVLVAERYPDIVASVTSVEGNFTLADAFWSSEIARLDDEGVERMFAGFAADPASWLARSGVSATEEHVAAVLQWFRNQPASTIRAMAASVVDVTRQPEYEASVKAVMGRPVPFHLVSGERSRSGWDVPGWALSKASSETIIPGTGHLLTLEEPELFGATIARLVRQFE